MSGRTRPERATVERRRIELGGKALEYALRRSPRRRSLALAVDEGGVRVAVPSATGLAVIESFIRQHADWLQDKLARRAGQTAAGCFELRDGAELPLFGRPLRLCLLPAGRTSRWRIAGDGCEELCLPGDGRSAAALQRALRRRALDWYRGRVEEYCLRLGVPVPPVRLSAARTRWGSCSRLSGIRLHWRLVHLQPSLIDYVVAHEVAHLLEMNHSPRFWAVVESLYPGWRAARRALRTAGEGLPRLPGADSNDPS